MSLLLTADTWLRSPDGQYLVALATAFVIGLGIGEMVGEHHTRGELWWR